MDGGKRARSFGLEVERKKTEEEENEIRRRGCTLMGRATWNPKSPFQNIDRFSPLSSPPTL